MSKGNNERVKRGKQIKYIAQFKDVENGCGTQIYNKQKHKTFL